jgi:type III restriction enzyme
VPGVNNLATHGRWAFAEFTEVYQMQVDFAKKVEDVFNTMINDAVHERNWT